jgi:hypothetical protein
MRESYHSPSISTLLTLSPINHIRPSPNHSSNTAIAPLTATTASALPASIFALFQLRPVKSSRSFTNASLLKIGELVGIRNVVAGNNPYGAGDCVHVLRSGVRIG